MTAPAKLNELRAAISRWAGGQREVNGQALPMPQEPDVVVM